MTIEIKLTNRNDKNYDREATDWLENGDVDVITHYSKVIVVYDAIACQLKNKKNEWEIYFPKSNPYRECEFGRVVSNIKNPRKELAEHIYEHYKRVAAEKAAKEVPTPREHTMNLIIDAQKQYLKDNNCSTLANYGWVTDGDEDKIIVCTKSFDKKKDKEAILTTTAKVGDSKEMFQHKLQHR